MYVVLQLVLYINHFCPIPAVVTQILTEKCIFIFLYLEFPLLITKAYSCIILYLFTAPFFLFIVWLRLFQLTVVQSEGVGLYRKHFN